MRINHKLLARCFKILELLASNPGWKRLSDIAQKLELEGSTIHRLLTEMGDLGWVEQDESTARYRLTQKLPVLGQQYLYGTGLPELVQPILDKAAEQCRELVRMKVIDGNRLVWFASAQGAPPGLVYRPSMTGTNTLHATASGQAWLATMDEKPAVTLALGAGLGQAGNYGGHAIRTTNQLLKELKQTRQRGYGLSIEENEPGIAVVAVAVHAQADQHVIGIISVAGPIQRMKTERLPELGKMLNAVATKLSNALEN